METAEIECWIVADGMGSYIEKFHEGGDNIIYFTTDREKAMKTTCPEHALRAARVARESYKRTQMRIANA